jgi:hypothetical protein
MAYIIPTAPIPCTDIDTSDILFFHSRCTTFRNYSLFRFRCAIFYVVSLRILLNLSFSEISGVSSYLKTTIKMRELELRAPWHQCTRCFHRRRFPFLCLHSEIARTGVAYPVRSASLWLKHIYPHSFLESVTFMYNWFKWPGSVSYPRI